MLDKRQPVAVGRDHPDPFARDFELGAVERIARTFLAGGVNDAWDEAREDFGGNLGELSSILMRLWKVIGAQAIHLEPRRRAVDRSLVEIIGFAFDLCLRQRFD